MKNIIIAIFAIILMIISFITEPLSDTIDVVAGSTNDTYQSSMDTVAGVSFYADDDDDEEDEEDDEDEHEEDDD